MSNRKGCGHKNKVQAELPDGKKSLAESHPELAKELVGIDPQSIQSGTSKKLPWKCGKCGYEWSASCSYRIRGIGCACCANLVAVPGKNTLKDTHPELAKEMVGDPCSIVAGSTKVVRWCCKKCRQEWSVACRIRARGAGCPYCSGRRPTPGVNTMDITHPHLAKELIGDPSTIHAGTGKKLGWRCSKCNHRWQTTGDARARGNGCPCCAGRVPVPGKNTLVDSHPHLVPELIGDPYKVTAGSHRKSRWKCKKCHLEWIAPCHARARGNGCPFCARKLAAPGYNTMDVTHPDLAKELVGDPSMVISGTNKKHRWRCSRCAFVWEASGANRAKGTGCPACINFVVVPGKNSMADTHPHLAAELVGDPTKVLATTERKLSWKCSKCGFCWRANARNRSMGCGCPACAGKSVCPGKNDMATTHHELAKQLVGTDPRKVMATGRRRLKWQCDKCDCVWVTSCSVRIRGHGCPKCAARGFDSSKPAFFYLIHRPGQFKIGIGNEGGIRLTSHSRKNWRLLEKIAGDGEVIATLETIVKRRLKAMKIPTGPDAFREPFDGYTEAWNAADLEAWSLDELFASLDVDIAA